MRGSGGSFLWASPSLMKGPAAIPLPFSRRSTYFGRFDPVKGHREFFEIYALYRKRALSRGDPVCRLRIVGMPANLSLEDLKTAAEQEGLLLGEQLCFEVEQVADKYRLLESAALGVVCSLGSEEICRVAQEFLVSGTSLMVSGVGGLGEVLFSDLAGFSYQGMTAEDSGRALADFLHAERQDPLERRHKRALQAREIFSIAKMAEQLEAMLQSH